jgi:hypothetical protein
LFHDRWKAHDGRVSQDLFHLADVQDDIRARAVDRHRAHRLQAAKTFKVQLTGQQLGALNWNRLRLYDHDQLVAFIEDGIEPRVEAGANVKNNQASHVSQVIDDTL